MFLCTKNKMNIEKIKNILIENGLKIAVAESCTGGLISSFLTDIDGASEFFEEGFITYSERAKIKLLGVKPDAITNNGVVSNEVARQMAIGLVEKYPFNIGLSTTGYLGPTGGDETNPIGTVYIGMVHKKSSKGKKCRVIKYQSPCTNRVEIKTDIAKKALKCLEEFLEA